MNTQETVGAHRAGTALVGIGLLVFGVLGFSDQLDFFATTGTPILGLPTNIVLSAASVVTALVLIGTAISGGRIGRIAAVVIGAVFVLSGVVHLLIIGTPLNVLTFRVSNAVFSLVVGAILLAVAAYGRFRARTHVGAPRRTEGDAGGEQRPDRGGQMLPGTPAEVTATVEMAEAERAVAAGTATRDQRRGVDSMNRHRDTDGRRAAWRGRPGDASG